MCKEDVRLGRETEAVRTVAGSLSTSATQLMKPNPNRKTAIITIGFNFPADPLGYGIVRAGAADGIAVGIMNVYNPTLVLTIETHGDAARQSLWVTGTAPNDEQIEAVEVRWNKPLEDQ